MGWWVIGYLGRMRCDVMRRQWPAGGWVGPWVADKMGGWVGGRRVGGWMGVWMGVWVGSGWAGEARWGGVGPTGWVGWMGGMGHRASDGGTM